MFWGGFFGYFGTKKANIAPPKMLYINREELALVALSRPWDTQQCLQTVLAVTTRVGEVENGMLSLSGRKQRCC